MISGTTGLGLGTTGLGNAETTGLETTGLGSAETARLKTIRLGSAEARELDTTRLGSTGLETTGPETTKAIVGKFKVGPSSTSVKRGKAIAWRT